MSGSSILASATTDASGIADFSDANVDLSQPYDIRLERGDMARTYRQLVPDQLANAPLVLPATLVGALEDELAGLDTTHTLVLGYDTEPARQLIGDWTSRLTPDGTNALAPEDASVLRDRDRALARLLIASEGLEDLYLAVEPLADETAKTTVDAFMALVALRKLVLDAEASAQQTIDASGEPPTVSDIALKLALQATKGSLTVFKSLMVDAASSVLPSQAAQWLVKADQVAISTGSAAFSTGAWNGAAARRSIIEQAFTTASKEVGSVVLASGHVLAAEGDLEVAAIRTRQIDGDGTTIESFQATQTYLNGRTALIDDTINSSATFTNIFNGWNKAADLAVVAGTVPSMQWLALVGAALRLIDTGGLVTFVVADLRLLYDATFDYAPTTTALAFDPSATASVVFVDPEPARRQAASTRQAATEAYLDRLDAVMAAIEAEDYDTAVAEAEALLADDDALEEAFEVERLRLIALAEKALARDDEGGNTRSARPQGSFADAYASSTAAATGLIGEQMSFYSALAATFVPELALSPEGSSEPPFAARDSLLAIAPRLSAAVTTASSAMDTALGLTDGLVAEALVMFPEHGLPDPAGRSGWTAPDQQIPFQARVVNAGDEAATGVEVRLVIDGDTTGGDPVLRVISDRVQSVAELAPGVEETLTWWVATRDTSSTGSGSAAVYELVTSATSGRVRGATGGVEVTSAAPVSEEAPAEQVTEVSLRVYPNPTRGASSMQIDLPSPARVHLAIYDALGREVAVGLDDDRSAGRHVIELATQGLAPGVYIVRLTAGDALATQQLTVVR
ncbi:MAG: T9SS type A sorting domain-containing protein [Bacteroidota bacterium]